MTQKKQSPVPTGALFVSISEGMEPVSTTTQKSKPSPPAQPAAQPSVNGIARSPAPYYTGVSHAFVGIYKRDGLRGLFAGVGPRVIWTGCQSIVMFVAYETLLGMAGNWRLKEWKG
jgi:hypothetical protein